MRPAEQKPTHYDPGDTSSLKRDSFQYADVNLSQDYQYANLYESDSHKHAESANNNIADDIDAPIGLQLEYTGPYEDECHINNGLEKHYPSVAYASPYESNSIKASAPYYEDVKSAEEQDTRREIKAADQAENKGFTTDEMNDESLVQAKHTKLNREPTYIEIVS